MDNKTSECICEDTITEACYPLPNWEEQIDEYMKQYADHDQQQQQQRVEEEEEKSNEEESIAFEMQEQKIPSKETLLQERSSEQLWHKLENLLENWFREEFDKNDTSKLDDQLKEKETETSS